MSDEADRANLERIARALRVPVDVLMLSRDEVVRWIEEHPDYVP